MLMEPSAIQMPAFWEPGFYESVMELRIRRPFVNLFQIIKNAL